MHKHGESHGVCLLARKGAACSRSLRQTLHAAVTSLGLHAQEVSPACAPRHTQLAQEVSITSNGRAERLYSIQYWLTKSSHPLIQTSWTQRRRWWRSHSCAPGLQNSANATRCVGYGVLFTTVSNLHSSCIRNTGKQKQRRYGISACVCRWFVYTVSSPGLSLELVPSIRECRECDKRECDKCFLFLCRAGLRARFSIPRLLAECERQAWCHGALRREVQEVFWAQQAARHWKDDYVDHQRSWSCESLFHFNTLYTTFTWIK